MFMNDIVLYVIIASVTLALVFAKMAVVIISQSETRVIERLVNIVRHSSRALISLFLSSIVQR